MPAPLDATPTIEEVTLQTNETWQCVNGTVWLYDYAPNADQEGKGNRLHSGGALPLPSGATIRYRSEGTEATIARIITL